MWTATTSTWAGDRRGDRPADAPLVAVSIRGTLLHATVDTTHGIIWTVTRDARGASGTNPYIPARTGVYQGTQLFRLTDRDGVRLQLVDGLQPVYLSGDLAVEGPAPCSS